MRTRTSAFSASAVSRQNKKGRPYGRPLKVNWLVGSLELEPHRPLNLAFTEERAAGCVNTLEGVIENERLCCRGRQAARCRSAAGRGIDTGIFTRHLRAVENVEAFEQNFERLGFVEPEPA